MMTIGSETYEDVGTAGDTCKGLYLFRGQRASRFLDSKGLMNVLFLC
jgi:hypothetical protein